MASSATLNPIGESRLSMIQSSNNVQEAGIAVSILKDAKILFIFHGLELGGAENQALLLANYLLRQQGADVQIWGLGFKQAGRAADLCDKYGIPWRVIPFHRGRNILLKLRDLFKFIRSLRIEQPEVLLPYTWFPNYICGLTWKFTGAKMYIWNQRDEGRIEGNEQIYHRLAVLLTRHFISNSQHAKDFLVRKFGVNPENVDVIYNGTLLNKVDVDRTMWRKSMGISGDCFVACMIANLHGYKDHITLLKAWRKVVDNLSMCGISSRLLLAGRLLGQERILKELLSELGLSGNVTFLGQVNNVPELLSAVDIGVHSSKYEGCPNGVLECMAAGLAVVGTDIPGIREAVGSEAYKYLAAPDDAEAMADLITKFALNKDLCMSVGAANRERIQKEFGLERMCKETSTVIINGLQSAKRRNDTVDPKEGV